MKNNFLSAFKWSYLAYIIPNLILPIFTIFIARILSPSDYGIFALNLVFVSAVNTFQSAGFRPIIIKDQEVNNKKKSTLFYFSVILGFSGFMLLVVLSPIIAYIFNEPLINKSLPILSLILIFNSISIVQLSFLEKKLKFKKIFFIRLLPLLCVALVTLPLAYFGYGYRALIFGEIAKSITLSLSYIWFSKWIPDLIFDRRYFFESFDFGKWVSFEKVLEFSIANIDKILMGYLFSTSLLGVYSMARQVVNILYGFITAGITPVLMPLFQNYMIEHQKFLKTVNAVFNNVIFINFSLLLFISLVSINLFALILPEWDQLGLFVIILSLGETFVRSINPSRDIFKLKNKPELYPKNLIINNLFILTTYPFLSYQFGVYGLLFGRFVNDIIYFFLQYHSLKKIMQNSISFHLIFLIKIIFINSIVFLVCNNLIQFFYNKDDHISTLIISMITYFVIFMFFHFLLNRRFFLDFTILVRKVILDND